MPTPTKPVLVLATEGKSHRTKAELKVREEGEKALKTNQKIKPKKEVKNNKIAYKEFKRIVGLLENIDKSDALYENVINRYALLYAECYEFEERREEFYNLISQLREEEKELIAELKDREDIDELLDYKLEYGKSLAKMMSSMLAIDKQIQNKRRLMFDIEKENIMTIASQLRSIPKKADNDENPLLKVLRGEA